MNVLANSNKYFISLFRFTFLFIYLFSPLCIWGTDEDSPPNIHTFGGQDNIQHIHVYAVYYLHQNVTSLSDWNERIDYHLQRAQKFHHRELASQSRLTYSIYPKPFIATKSKDEFPKEDVNAFYWHIINDVWHSGKIEFAKDSFPILLVFSDMNFSPGYDDWTRTCDGKGCPFPEPHSDCQGWITDRGEDRPGSRCGGARSVYWPEKHIGLGLVTADGWRVPIKGSDCVVYHEGIGHAIGLPHPEPLNDSVMGLAQYVDSIQKTWIDEDQKETLGWQKTKINRLDLFSTFEVYHTPSKPSEKDSVTITATFPSHFSDYSIKAEYQTILTDAFQEIETPSIKKSDSMTHISWTLPPRPVGKCVGYRIRICASDNSTETIWNYFQIRH